MSDRFAKRKRKASRQRRFGPVFFLGALILVLGGVVWVMRSAAVQTLPSRLAVWFAEHKNHFHEVYLKRKALAAEQRVNTPVEEPATPHFEFYSLLSQNQPDAPLPTVAPSAAAPVAPSAVPALKSQRAAKHTTGKVMKPQELEQAFQSELAKMHDVKQPTHVVYAHPIKKQKRNDYDL